MGNGENIILKPSSGEVDDFLKNDSRKHCLRMESYGHLMGFLKDDPQRPHDFVGSGNKLEWGVIWGMALQYCNINQQEVYRDYVAPSIGIHRRGQIHHQKWNYLRCSPTEADMLGGATDTLLAMFGGRHYILRNGDTFNSLESIIPHINEPYQVEWVEKAYAMMSELDQFDIEKISKGEDIPDLILPNGLVNEVDFLINSCIERLRENHGYEDLEFI
jgi:hypothetical protein